MDTTGIIQTIKYFSPGARFVTTHADYLICGCSDPAGENRCGMYRDLAIPGTICIVQCNIYII